MCDVLSNKDASSAVAAAELDPSEYSHLKWEKRGRPPLIVSESGLYALALRSRKPEAKPFQKWVRSEVFPAIRRPSSLQPHPATPMTPEDKRDRLKAQRRAWKLANADKVKAQALAWYQANTDKAKAQASEWAQANPDKVAVKNKAWKLANADALAERAKLKRLDNPRPPRPPAPPRPLAVPAPPRLAKPRRQASLFCGPPTERQHAQALALIARRTKRRTDEAARVVQAAQTASEDRGHTIVPAPAAPSPAEMAQRRLAALANAERLMALMRAPAPP